MSAAASAATRTYRVQFEVEVEITVPEEAITRVLNNEDHWRETFYDLDHGGVVEMLARCCGINGARLSQLDGWGDMENGKVESSVKTEMTGWQQIKP